MEDVAVDGEDDILLLLRPGAPVLGGDVMLIGPTAVGISTVLLTGSCMASGTSGILSADGISAVLLADWRSVSPSSWTPETMSARKSRDSRNSVPGGDAVILLSRIQFGGVVGSLLIAMMYFIYVAVYGIYMTILSGLLCPKCD